ncbi:MAG: class I SAM-dependent methyltransferase [Methylococcaceae bacterium]|nr:class I SAM-dependent methyltransferase [Methylococcaceae bacterium]
MILTVEIFIIALLLLSIALSAYTFHKVRRVHLMQYDLQNQYQRFPDTLNLTYQQLQAFTALDRRLNLTYALPPLRGWAASPDFLLLLAEHVHRQQPEVIVECSSGASTIVLAQSAKQNGKGHVYSLEHDVHYAEKTRQALIKHGLQGWSTVIDAPLQDYSFAGQSYRWYKLDDEIQSKQIDMLIIDGPPANLNCCARYPAGPLLLPLLNKNAMVFLDDADRPDEQEIINIWMSKFPNLHAEKHNCEKGAVSLA